MTCPGYGQLLFNHLIQSGLKHIATLWIVMDMSRVWTYGLKYLEYIPVWVYAHSMNKLVSSPSRMQFFFFFFLFFFPYKYKNF